MTKRHSFNAVALALGIVSLGFSTTSSATVTIQKAIQDAEQHLKAKVGVSVLDAQGKVLFDYHADQRFPVMSTFKTLACAKLLHDDEKQPDFMAQAFQVNANDILDYAPVFKTKVGENVSLKAACDATMSTSDNSAANHVLKQIGGPAGITQFLVQQGDNITRLDRIEPFLNTAKPGDLRDTSTPYAMNKTLQRLLLGDVLSTTSKQQLTTWMKGNKVSNSLFRSVLPAGWDIADRSGAGGYGSRGINAVVWRSDHDPLVVSVYLTQTEATMPERDKAIAKIGHSIFEKYAK